MRTARADWLTLAVCCLLVAAWTFRALDDSSAGDFGAAYLSGTVAWGTGHPETFWAWTGTPLLAAVMALVTRVVSMQTGGVLITLLNVVVFAAATLALLSALRGRIPTRWWRLLALALCSFGPILSTVWFKQFNLLVLVAAVGGFALIRRGRIGVGAGLIGAAVAFKPLAILLPVALVIQRGTRRAGLIALAWVAGLSMLALAVLAWRAHSLSVLNPWAAYQNFSHKMDPRYFGYACFEDNYAPSATLCRLGGHQNFSAYQASALVLVALLALWVADALRLLAPASWDLFAFVCVLSVMLGPVAWSHYQIMLLPLFVVLLVRFAERGAARGVWAGFSLAFVLASLVWQPYGSLSAFWRTLVDSGRVSNAHVVLNVGLSATEAVAQFAQYVLLISGLLWYWRGRDADASSVQPDAAGGSAAS